MRSERSLNDKDCKRNQYQAYPLRRGGRVAARHLRISVHACHSNGFDLPVTPSQHEKGVRALAGLEAEGEVYCTAALRWATSCSQMRGTSVSPVLVSPRRRNTPARRRRWGWARRAARPR